MLSWIPRKRFTRALGMTRISMMVMNLYRNTRYLRDEMGKIMTIAYVSLVYWFIEKGEVTASHIGASSSSHSRACVEENYTGRYSSPNYCQSAFFRRQPLDTTREQDASSNLALATERRLFTSRPRVSEQKPDPPPTGLLINVEGNLAAT